MELYHDVLFYDKDRCPKVQINCQSLEKVSAILGVDIQFQILKIMETESLKKRIRHLENLKKDVVKWSKQYRKDHLQKNENGYYRVQMDANILKYRMFLDQLIHHQYKLLIQKNRTRKRKQTDLNKTFVLDGKENEIYQNMLQGEEISKFKVGNCLKSLAYLLKRYSYVERSIQKLETQYLDEWDGKELTKKAQKISVTYEISEETILRYIDQLVSLLMDSPFTFELAFDQVQLLKNVVNNRKKGTLKTESEEKEFWDKLSHCCDMLENYQIQFEKKVLEEQDDELNYSADSYIDLVLNGHNFYKVRAYLELNSDFIYLASPRNENVYFFYDIVEKYQNVLLNYQDYTEEATYYQKIIDYYIEQIQERIDDDLKAILYKKITQSLKVVYNSKLDCDRIEMVLCLINNHLKKLQNQSTTNPFHDLDQKNKFDLSHHYDQQSERKFIFTLSDANSPLDENSLSFENAYSYQEKNGIHLFDFYVIDVTKNKQTIKDSIDKMIWKIERGDRFFNRKSRDSLFFQLGHTKPAVAYHFEFDRNFKLSDLFVQKEDIRISRNFTFQEMDKISETNHPYGQLIRDFITFEAEILNQKNPIYLDNKESMTKQLEERLLFQIDQTLFQYAREHQYPQIGKVLSPKKVSFQENLFNFTKKMSRQELSISQINQSLHHLYRSGIYFTRDNDVIGNVCGFYHSPSTSLPAYLNQILFSHYKNSSKSMTALEDMKIRMSLESVSNTLNKHLIGEQLQKERESFQTPTTEPAFEPNGHQKSKNYLG